MILAATENPTSQFEVHVDDLGAKAKQEVQAAEARPAETNFAPVDWVSLVAGIRDGDASAMEELYRLFYQGVKFYLCRQLGLQELDDKIHDTFVIVVQAIRRGELREPERLMGYVRTVVRRQVAAHIHQVIHHRRETVDLDDGARLADMRGNPEQIAMVEEQTGLMAQVLRTISRRDREILTRFYLQEQSQDEICNEMGLSETQFRLLKSRAKQRFGELGRQRVGKEKKTQEDNILRKSHSAGH